MNILSLFAWRISSGLKLVAFLACAGCLPINALCANPLFDKLIEDGVEVSTGPALKLPSPSLADDMSPAEQRKVIDAIAQPNHNAESLLRNSVVAPFILKISDDEASKAAGGTGRHVDLWFVVYGDLQKLRDTTFLEKQAPAAKEEFEDDENNQGVELTAVELAERGIKLSQNRECRERYLAGSSVLFDRVRVRGTIYTNETLGDESGVFAMILDPRFVEDRVYPNSWQPIQRDEKGKLNFGKVHAYQGAGSYMKATQLTEPAGAIFVEYHLVFDEPIGWFNGANLLRSKLPILVQDSVRKFRRKLAVQK